MDARNAGRRRQAVGTSAGGRPGQVRCRGTPGGTAVRFAAAEALEGRRLLTVFTVTSVNDAGAGTLRQAIEQANANPGADSIHFNIPGGSTTVRTINPFTALPEVTGPVTIDGYTQPGSQPNTLAVGNNARILVELSGEFSAAAFGLGGLTITGGGTTVRGLAVNRFGEAAVLIRGGGGNSVRGNFLNTDPTGSLARGAFGADGVRVVGSGNNMVGGTNPADRNLISGISGGGSGVEIASVTDPNDGSVLTPAAGNVVLGNYIGTDAAGTGVPDGDGVFSGHAGVYLRAASDNVVGGAAAGAGNVIAGNGQYGVHVHAPAPDSRADRNQILGNLIGTNATGTAPLTYLGSPVAGQSVGVRVEGADTGAPAGPAGAADNAVGGLAAAARNVISRNSFAGVEIENTSGNNRVLGNYIGTDAAGTAVLGNSNAGVSLRSATGVSVAGNLISGNGTGVVIRGGGGGTVTGNRIGTNAAGTAAVPNTGAGVQLFFLARNYVIGGTAAGAGNLVSGNNGGGIVIDNGAAENTVQGNFVGTDAAGSSPLPNAGAFSNLHAITVHGDRNTIGGTTAGAGNVTAGNQGWGIYLDGDANNVMGNRVGVGADGGAMGNGFGGVAIVGGVDGRIGGTAAGAGNLIAYNAGPGVVVAGFNVNNVPRRHSILRNTIMHNAGLGIDLADAAGVGSVNANDPGDADTGNNDLQNHPDLSSATAGTSDVRVQGALNSTPSSSFRVEFFSNPAADESGFGEGRLYLGAATVNTNAAGSATIDFVVPLPAGGGSVITATATDAAGNTSEFSDAVTITGRQPAAPPAVSGVFFNSTAWAPAFRQFLAARGQGEAAFGFRVGAGAAQSGMLPWTNLNQVSIRFTENVQADRNDLTVLGANVARYAVTAYAYDPATRTATWTLAQSPGADRLQLQLNADNRRGGVTGADTGLLLDGEWNNDVTDAYPSGDGAQGGDFAFNVFALPGDVDRNVAVNIFDTLAVRNRQGTSTTSAGTAPNTYTAFHDVDGNGAINIFDTLAVRNRQGTTLPPPVGFVVSFGFGGVGTWRRPGGAAASLVDGLAFDGVPA